MQKKRVDNGVVATCVNKRGSFNNAPKYLLLVIGLILVAGIVAFAFVENRQVTGRATLEFNIKYKMGEPLEGDLKFNIKEGELVPKGSIVRTSYGNQSKDYALSDLVWDVPINGNYYAEGKNLQGNGDGFGVAGVYYEYPSIDFDLLVKSSDVSGDNSASSESNSVSSDVSVQDESSANSESSSEEQTTSSETSSGSVAQSTSESSTSESSTSESSTTDSSTESTGITGNSVAESEFVVHGSVKKGEDYSYNLEEGQTVSIVPGSVKMNGEAVDDGVVKLKTSSDKAVISTEYFVSKKGFGEEYLGDYALTLHVDIKNLDLKAEPGVLEVDLIYGDEVLASKSQGIAVSGNSDEKELEVLSNLSELRLIKKIGDLNIQKDSFYTINLANYIYGADSYSFAAAGISDSFDGSVLTLTPDNGLVGIKSAQIIAIKGNESITEEFSVTIYSSGDLNVTTHRDRIRVGQPVKWVKNVSVTDMSNISLSIPAESSNIVVKKVEGGISEQAEVQSEGNTITGLVSIDLNLDKQSPLKKWFLSFFRAFTGRVIDNQDYNNTGLEFSTKEVILAGDVMQYSVEYETPAPTALEEVSSTGKIVSVSAPESLGYTDVIASTEIGNEKGIKNASTIKIYWRNYGSLDEVKTVDEVPELVTVDETLVSDGAITGGVISDGNGTTVVPSDLESKRVGDYVLQEIPFDAYDSDSDGNIDYIEWVVPHFSTQTYEIILINKAEHLDSGRNSIEDIYNYVGTMDNSSVEIPAGDYVRVYFEKNLTSSKDITLYVSSSGASVEVYEKNGNSLIAKFDSISSYGEYKVYLTNLSGEQDSFDLKVLGASVDFDYIVDPTAYNEYNEIYQCGDIDASGDYYVNQSFSAVDSNCLVISADDVHIYGYGNVITGSGSYYGIYTDSNTRSGIEINELNITGFNSGIYFEGEGSYFVLSGLGFSNNSDYDIRFGNSQNVLSLSEITSTGITGYSRAITFDGSVYDSTLDNLNVAPYGYGSIYFGSQVSGTQISNVTSLAEGYPDGYYCNIQVAGSFDYSSIDSADISDQAQGICLDNGGTDSNISNVDVRAEYGSGICVSGSAYNYLINNVNMSGGYGGLSVNDAYDLRIINSTSINNLVSPLYAGNLYNSFLFEDSYFGRASYGGYYIGGSGQGITVRNSTYGQISFTGDVNSISDSYRGFSDDVYIGNNTAILNGRNLESGSWNTSANIQLFNLPTDFVNPVIFKDGEICTDCSAITDLNAGNVEFGGSGAGVYSVGDIPFGNPQINFTGDTPANGLTVEASSFSVNVTSSVSQAARSCTDLIGNPSGVYTVYLDGINPVDVYCDMDTNGGGWTVIFSSSDPTLWGTNSGTVNSGDWSIDVSKINIPFTDIMIKKESTGDYQTVSGVNQFSLYSCSAGSDGKYWDGSKSFGYSGYHLGISNSVSLGGGDTGYVTTSLDCNNDHHSWGFGHKYSVDDAQGWGWDSTDMGSTVFSIALKVDALSSSISGEHYVVNNFDNSLVGWWRGENNANDGVGLNSGSWSGTESYARGKFGRAMSFNGGSDIILSETAGSFATSQNFSISAWVKTSSSSILGIVSKKESSSPYTGYSFYLYGGSVVAQVISSYPSNWLQKTSSSTINDGAWHHVAFSYDGNLHNSTGLKIYIDGVEASTSIDADALSGSILNSVAFRIGNDPSGSYYFDGQVDDALIFNRSLSTFEIASLYNATANQYNNRFSGLQSGEHTFRVYAVNSEGDINSTELRSVTLNVNSIPQISFIGNTPTHGSLINTSSFVVNVSSSSSLISGEHYVVNNLDNSLVGWWRGENNSNDELGVRNGTWGGISNYTSGKFGVAMGFNGSNYVSVPLTYSSSVGITYSAWVYSNDNSGAPDIIHDDDTNVGIILTSSSGLEFQTEGMGSMYFNCNENNVPINQWTHVAATWNGTTKVIYVNGVQRCSLASQTGTLSFNYANIGSRGSNYFFKGRIDDALIFNRSLSASEIASLYNATTNHYYNNFTGLAEGNHSFKAYAVDSAGNKNSTETRNIAYDISIPSINYGVGTESDGASIARRNIVLNVTASDSGSGLKNITIYVYNSTSLVNSTTTTTSPKYVNVTVSNEGTYYFNATAYDNIGRKNTTETRNVTLDTISPQISFSSETDNSESSLTRNNVIVNVSSSDYGRHYVVNNFDNSLVGWWRGENNANDELGINNGTWSGTESYASGKFGNAMSFSGSNYVNFGNKLDQNGSTPFSISVWFKTTSGGDNVYQFVSKQTMSFPYTGYSFGINEKTGTSVNAGKIGFSIIASATGNNYIAKQTNLTFNDGLWHHAVVVYNGSRTFSSIGLYVDGVLQTATESWGGTFSGSSSTSKNLEIGARDGSQQAFVGSIDDVMVLNRTLSASEILSLYSATANQYYNNFTSLSQGNHTFKAYAVDSAGNKNSTEARNLNIVLDYAYPQFSGYEDNNGTLINSGMATFNVTVANTNGSVFMNINNIDYQAANVSDIYSVSVPLNAGGNYDYYWFGYGNGSRNLYNVSSTRVYTVIDDSVNPLVSYGLGTENDNEVSAGSIYVNVSVAEVNEASVVFTLSNASGVVNATTLSAGNRVINWINLSAGNYWYNVSALDLGGNGNSTSNRNITLLPSCLSSLCVEGGVCVVANDCYLYSSMCANNTCQFSNMTISAKIYTLYNSSGDGNSLVLNISGNSNLSYLNLLKSSPITFLSGNSIFLDGKNGSTVTGGSAGGNAGVLNITTPGLFNTTAARFFARGGFTSLASGAGGNGGIVQLNYHGLIRNFTDVDFVPFVGNRPSLLGGNSTSMVAGTRGRIVYNKDLRVPLDVDLTGDGRVTLTDVNLIKNNYNSRSTVSSSGVQAAGSFSSNLDINGDNLLNVQDIAKVGFEFLRGEN